MWKRNKEEVRGGKLTYVEKHGRQKKRRMKGKTIKRLKKRG